jgi:4-hydroxy-tetrahydrodipicolinate synthase
MIIGANNTGEIMNSATLGDRLGHVIIPLITPFDDAGHVNYGEAEKLADYLIRRKYCDSMIVAGTTGEFYALNTKERIELFTVVKKAVNGRIPVVAGAGSACAGEVLNLVKEAEKLKYEVAMVTAPFYCRTFSRSRPPAS